ncbi:MAG: hypothetical protein E7446_02645 [Ruminococcaceae bacterium]|nr:hypothetical protein [Oscillospiraceae bacterium]
MESLSAPASICKPITQAISFCWIPLIPGTFYAFITTTYIINAKIGFNVPWTPAYIAGGVLAAAYLFFAISYGKKRAAKVLK